MRLVLNWKFRNNLHILWHSVCNWLYFTSVLNRTNVMVPPDKWSCTPDASKLEDRGYYPKSSVWREYFVKYWGGDICKLPWASRIVMHAYLTQESQRLQGMQGVGFQYHPATLQFPRPTTNIHVPLFSWSCIRDTKKQKFARNTGRENFNIIPPHYNFPDPLRIFTCPTIHEHAYLTQESCRLQGVSFQYHSVVILSQ